MTTSESTMHTERAAAIAADYKAGVKVSEIRRKHRVSSEAVRSVLVAHGIKSRGYGFKPDNPERLAAIAADLQSGMLLNDVRRKHKCGSEEVARAKRVHGVKRPPRVARPAPPPHEDPRLLAICADYKAGATLEQIKIDHQCGADTVMRAVRALGETRTAANEGAQDVEEAIRQMARAGDSMAKIKQKLRVGFRRVHRVCGEAGIELVQWYGGRKAEPRRESKPKKRLPVAVISAPPPADPTREDYARLCDQEFSTPHYLRKAPDMLKVIEANEARERARIRNARRGA